MNHLSQYETPTVYTVKTTKQHANFHIPLGILSETHRARCLPALPAASCLLSLSLPPPRPHHDSAADGARVLRGGPESAEPGLSRQPREDSSASPERNCGARLGEPAGECPAPERRPRTFRRPGAKPQTRSSSPGAIGCGERRDKRRANQSSGCWRGRGAHRDAGGSGADGKQLSAASRAPGGQEGLPAPCGRRRRREPSAGGRTAPAARGEWRRRPGDEQRSPGAVTASCLKPHDGPRTRKNKTWDHFKSSRNLSRGEM
ncbi:uncharacterized protein LOC113223297 [Piliocolobus tephrosceles]|uniref:uncharacterized protein LOC113223296 n=1 Tax=Piliocolobus tephrosceles TaxID=591936 RepID=UPI000E6AEFF9|nr:uncharacterized protein LOC113223296 [Piliocolobus tephrosceles]XP_026308564.1 uncharacterized protein LOC113223297 [Piliocolobus tephrosceles]